MDKRQPETPVFTLRDALPDEADAIGALIQAAYAEYESQYTPEAWARYFAMLGEASRHFERAEVIVAEAGADLAGVVMFYADGSLSGQGEWPPGWAGMLRLAVHPGFRGQGIGRVMTEACIRRARVSSAPVLGLHTTDWMKRAHAMYERMGFVRDPSFDFVTRGGTGAMGYRLDLAYGPGA